MRIALLMHPWQLSMRGKWTWDDIYNDPRGMSGSELGFVEMAKALVELEHRVTMFTDSESHVFGNGDVRYEHYVLPWSFLGDKWKGKFDLAIAVNHTDGLQHFDCPKLTLQWLNSFEFLSRQQVELTDHWASPSVGHRDFIVGQTHAVDQDRYGKVHGSYTPDPSKWHVVPLGCDPGAYSSFTKVPGRVVYTSSPDRGLHHLLHVWPQIKRAVPHAALEIYYRLQPWLDDLARAHWNEHIGENKQRALYINEALRRLSDPKWGVRVMGAVSRNRIAQALGEAECFAYSCSTLRYSEGFSCSTLEACAARACPVIWDCDALGGIYRGAAEVLPRDDEEQFASTVIRALTDPGFREGVNERCANFAAKMTWQESIKRLLEICQTSSVRSMPKFAVSEDAGNGSRTGTDLATAGST